jgi:hypothetical protein
MTTGLTYSTYVTQIATMSVVPETDPNYVIIIPQMITYAENRLCRDLDFLSTQVSNTYTLTSGSNSLSIPTSDFVTLETVNINISGTLTPVLPVAKEFLQNVWGSNNTLGVPTYFAVYGGDLATTGKVSQNLIFGPWPDSNYTISVTGTARPASLSATNTTTFISNYLPDLMIMVSMIYISAYQRNFGRQADDPAMAQSYENQYQLLLKSASVEEARKKFQSSGWTSYSPAAAATPSRG